MYSCDSCRQNKGMFAHEQPLHPFAGQSDGNVSHHLAHKDEKIH